MQSSHTQRSAVGGKRLPCQLAALPLHECLAVMDKGKRENGATAVSLTDAAATTDSFRIWEFKVSLRVEREGLPGLRHAFACIRRKPGAQAGCLGFRAAVCGSDRACRSLPECRHSREAAEAPPERVGQVLTEEPGRAIQNWQLTLGLLRPQVKRCPRSRPHGAAPSLPLAGAP